MICLRGTQIVDWEMLKSVVYAIVCAVALMFAVPPVTNAEVSGVLKMIDGETVEIGGARFRLYGIDAPDPGQSCEIRGREYNCGHVSKTALMDLVAGVKIRCILRALPGLATCYANGYDLAEGMVHTGWAMAMKRDGGKYLRIEREAERARRGLWQGNFVAPWDWKPD